jgi:hypothetical protein
LHRPIDRYHLIQRPGIPTVLSSTGLHSVLPCILATQDIYIGCPTLAANEFHILVVMNQIQSRARVRRWATRYSRILGGIRKTPSISQPIHKRGPYRGKYPYKVIHLGNNRPSYRSMHTLAHLQTTRDTANLQYISEGRTLAVDNQ